MKLKLVGACSALSLLLCGNVLGWIDPETVSNEKRVENFANVYNLLRTSSEECKKLRDEKLGYLSEKVELLNEIEELKKQNPGAVGSAELLELRSQNEKQQKKIDELESSLKSAVAEKARLSELQKQLDSLKEENNAMKAKNEEMTKKLGIANSELEKLKKQPTVEGLDEKELNKIMAEVAEAAKKEVADKNYWSLRRLKIMKGDYRSATSTLQVCSGEDFFGGKKYKPGGYKNVVDEWFKPDFEENLVAIARMEKDKFDRERGAVDDIYDELAGLSNAANKANELAQKCKKYRLDSKEWEDQLTAERDYYQALIVGLNRVIVMYDGRSEDRSDAIFEVIKYLWLLQNDGEVSYCHIDKNDGVEKNKLDRISLTANYQKKLLDYFSAFGFKLPSMRSYVEEKISKLTSAEQQHSPYMVVKNLLEHAGNREDALIKVLSGDKTTAIVKEVSSMKEKKDRLDVWALCYEMLTLSKYVSPDAKEDVKKAYNLMESNLKVALGLSSRGELQEKITSNNSNPDAAKAANNMYNHLFPYEKETVQRIITGVESHVRAEVKKGTIKDSNTLLDSLLKYFEDENVEVRMATFHSLMDQAMENLKGLKNARNENKELILNKDIDVDSVASVCKWMYENKDKISEISEISDSENVDRVNAFIELLAKLEIDFAGGMWEDKGKIRTVAQNYLQYKTGDRDMLFVYDYYPEAVKARLKEMKARPSLGRRVIGGALKGIVTAPFKLGQKLRGKK